MISPLDAASQILIANLDRIGENIAQANQQISSGVRVSTPSDAPASIADILDLQSGIGRSEQIQANLAGVKAEVDTADSALQSGVSMMDRARTLAAMGATSTYGVADRQAMAGEVLGILQSMIALSNTTVDGRYIFGGDKDGTAPYKYDTTQPDNVDRTNAPAASTRLIEAPDGSRFSVARSAQDIFDAGPNSVFTALSALAAALQTGDSNNVSAVVGSVQNAGTYLNSQLTFYGTASNNIRSATDAASKQETQLKASLSQERDTDIPSAALALQQASLNQQAALSAFANRPHRSLFDFLG